MILKHGSQQGILFLGSSLCTATKPSDVFNWQDENEPYPWDVTSFGSGESVTAKPIAHWTVPTNQWVDSSVPSVTVGIASFHINDIEKIEFAVNGSSQLLEVTEGTLDADTNVFGYTATIPISSLPENELIRIDARVVPATSGTPRAMDSLWFFRGSARPSVYVDAARTEGDPSNDGSTTNPYATIHEALWKYSSGLGGTATAPHSIDGLRVRLKAGEHVLASNIANQTTYRSDYSWVTIEPSDGLNTHEVVVVPPPGNTGKIAADWIQLKNLTIRQSKLFNLSYLTANGMTEEDVPWLRSGDTFTFNAVEHTYDDVIEARFDSVTTAGYSTAWQNAGLPTKGRNMWVDSCVCEGPNVLVLDDGVNGHTLLDPLLLDDGEFEDESTYGRYYKWQEDALPFNLDFARFAYATNTVATGYGDGLIDFDLIRQCEVNYSTGDFWSYNKAIINCSSYNCGNYGGVGSHRDYVQYGLHAQAGDPEVVVIDNLLIYNWKMINCTGQSLFVMGDNKYYNNIAFVNVYTENNDDVIKGAIPRPVDHCLLLHYTMHAQLNWTNIASWVDPAANLAQLDSKNVLVNGCVFESFGYNTTTIDGDTGFPNQPYPLPLTWNDSFRNNRVNRGMIGQQGSYTGVLWGGLDANGNLDAATQSANNVIVDGNLVKAFDVLDPINVGVQHPYRWQSGWAGQVPNSMVKVDVDNNLRGANASIGAYENAPTP